MILRPASFALSLSVIGCVLFELMICGAHAAEKQKGRKIEFSEPGSSEITTNLNQLTNKKDSLKQLEEDLSVPWINLTPKSSLDGVMAPPIERPATPTVPNKKVKEAIERRKYWYIMNPEDLTIGPTAEEMFKLPEFDKNGQEKKQKSPLEKYLERQSKGDGFMQDSKEKESGSRKRFKTREELDKDKDDDNEDLPDSIAKTSKSLKTMNESNSSNNVLSPLSRSDTFTDVFGVEKSRASELSPPQIAAQKARLEEFKQLLNFSPTLGAGAVDQVDSLNGVNDLRSGAAGGLDTLPNSLRFDTAKPLASPLTSQVNPINPTAFSPPVALGGLPDITPKVFTPAGSLPPAARLDPPRPIAPSPVFSVPQRKF